MLSTSKQNITELKSLREIRSAKHGKEFTSGFYQTTAPAALVYQRVNIILRFHSIVKTSRQIQASRFDKDTAVSLEPVNRLARAPQIINESPGDCYHGEIINVREFCVVAE